MCVCGYGIMHHRVFNFPGVAVCSEPDCACRGSPAPATAACGMFRAGHDTPEDMRQPVCIPCFDAAPVRPTNQSCDCRLPNIERDGYDFRNMVPRLLEGVHDMIKTVCGPTNLPLFVANKTQSDMERMITCGTYPDRPVLFSISAEGQLILAIDPSFVAGKMHGNIMTCLRLVREMLDPVQLPAAAAPPPPPPPPADAAEDGALPPPVRVAV